MIKKGSAMAMKNFANTWIASIFNGCKDNNRNNRKNTTIDEIKAYTVTFLGLRKKVICNHLSLYFLYYSRSVNLIHARTRLNFENCSYKSCLLFPFLQKSSKIKEQVCVISGRMFFFETNYEKYD